MSARVVLAFALGAVAALGVGVGVAGSADPTAAAPETASAVAIRILVPGASAAGTHVVEAPPDPTPLATDAFAYPAGGAVVTASSTSASAAADGAATATSGVFGLVLFGGEITADSVLARSSAVVTGKTAGGGFDGTAVQNVQALGAPVTGGKAQLADWGTLTLDVHDVERTSSAKGGGYSGSVVALEVRLTADHGGLPAGTAIQIGYAEAAAQSIPPEPEPETQTTTEPKPPTGPRPPAEPKPTTTPQPKPETTPKPAEQKPAPLPGTPAQPLEPPEGLFPFPEELTPELEGGPYVFPVFGEAGYGNTYGAFRSDVTYHHGDDIFGELGQPVVAVADGTAFSVGWNKIGGNRLWVRDKQGNAFYYAHLSAFSTLVFNGARVKLGQVIGFMGTTGDADGTPVHLHFEVHPVSLLYLGYDGAIDPTPFLDEARRLKRLPYPVPPGWAPSQTGSNAAPQPGAILLSVADISSADGLDAESLRRAIEAPEARP